MRHALGLFALLLASTAGAQDAPSAETPAQTGIIGAPGGGGKMPAVAEAEPSLPGHTLYHPATLPKAKLPVVVWGEGACRDNGLQNAQFLRAIASHGYLVIAVGAPRRELPLRPLPTGPLAPAVPGAPGGTPPAGGDETQAAQLIEAIDWAAKANATGRFAGRLRADRVAVMGHSCGGLQALSAAADPRVTTAMIWNSGIYTRPGGRSGIRLEKVHLARLHTPIAYVNGGPSDIAYENARDDFLRIDHQPVLFAHMPVGHSGTFWADATGGAYTKVAVAWLDWQLKGDAKAGRDFTGAGCGLCKRPGWSVERKRL